MTRPVSLIASVGAVLSSGLLAAVPASAAKPAAATIIALPLQPVVPETQRTCAAKTASGLGYSELGPGTGAKPGATDYVLVNYIGYLAVTGEVFDQGMSTPMTVDGTIPGFTEALQMIPKGGIYRFCIPSALAYGDKAAGPIPPNSDLDFQVELLDSRTVAEVEAMRAQAAAQKAAEEGQSESAGH